MLRDTLSKYTNFYQLCMSVPDYNFQDIDENHEDDATSGKTYDSSSIPISSSSNGNNNNETNMNGTITDDEDNSISSYKNNGNYNINMKSKNSSSLLKQNIVNSRDSNTHATNTCNIMNSINYDERDPLTLEPYTDTVFYFRPPNTTLEIKYNAESLICYFLSTGKLIDPVTSLPLSETDLEELDRLKTLLIEQSQVNNDNNNNNNNNNMNGIPIHSNSMEVVEESISATTATSAHIPIQYSNSHCNNHNIETEDGGNSGSCGSSGMVIAPSISFKSYFEMEEFKSNKAMEKEKNYQVLNLESMLGEVASSLLDVVERNKVNENSEIEISMFCSQYDCLFQQLKELDLEKAYQMLKSSEAFIKGPKKKPTPVNSLFQSVRQFLLTLWTEKDEKSLDSYRDEAAVRSRSGSIDSSYSGGYAFGTSPASFGSSLSTSLTVTTGTTTTTNTTTNSSTNVSHRLDIQERSDSQDSSMSNISLLSTSMNGIGGSYSAPSLYANNDPQGDSNSNSNSNTSMLSTSMQVIFENSDADNDNTDELDTPTTTTTTMTTSSHSNNDSSISGTVQGTALLLLPPDSVPPTSMLAPVDTAPSPPSPPPSSEECEGSVEVLGLGLEDSNDEEEEEAFFGAFSV